MDGARVELAERLASVGALDHHAHLLVEPGPFPGLAPLLTESDDPRQIAQVRDHPAHHRALSHLARFLGVEADDGAVRAAIEAEPYEALTRRLLEACHLEEMLVDDGFRPPGALPLARHAALVPCPVRRVVRLEALVEDCATDWPGFDEVGARFTHRLEEALSNGAAGLKTIAAYRCGLDLPLPDPGEAAVAYRRWRDGGVPRLTEAAVISYFLHLALEIARAGGRPVPLQVHAGIGDRSLVAARSDPSLLWPLLEGSSLGQAVLVLLHCYPYVRQAGYLAHLHAGVHLDLSLALTLAPHRGADLVAEALELAPATKLLFATDASRRPELFFLAAGWGRSALAEALGRLVDEGAVPLATATRWGELVLAGNARRLYGPPPGPWPG